VSYHISVGARKSLKWRITCNPVERLLYCVCWMWGLVKNLRLCHYHTVLPYSWPFCWYQVRTYCLAALVWCIFIIMRWVDLCSVFSCRVKLHPEYESTTVLQNNMNYTFSDTSSLLRRLKPSEVRQLPQGTVHVRLCELHQ